MSFSHAQIDAMEEAGLTREQIFSLLKAEARADEQRAANRRSGATERKRRQRARCAFEPVTPITRDRRDIPSAPPDGPPLPPAPPTPPLNPPDHPHSDPNGSGPGHPAPGAKARLFSEGRPALVALGLSRREAGALIGR